MVCGAKLLKILITHYVEKRKFILETYLDLDTVKTILHHREPYLMVDEVIEMTKNKIKAQKKNHQGMPYIIGHFPNLPVIPGAMMQELCTQSAGILLKKHYLPSNEYAAGVLHRVRDARYTKITHPDSPLSCEVDLIDFVDQLYRFKAKVFSQGEVVARMEFDLMNILESYLN